MLFNSPIGGFSLWYNYEYHSLARGINMNSLFDLDEKEQYLTINDTANLLSVSVATIRNWIKAGKLTPSKMGNRKKLFRKTDVLQIKNDIETNRFQRLKSRRNKKAITGIAIPTEYVNYKPYIQLTETICKLAERIESPHKIRLILFEVAVKLLQKRSFIQNNKQSTFIELFLANQLNLQPFTKVFQELFSSQQSPFAHDLEILKQIHSLDIPFIEGEDVLGLIYMSLNSLGKRKNSGSYYTPTAIVENVVNETLKLASHITSKKIIDPCCGSGNFILKTFLKLRDEHTRLGKSIEDAELFILKQQLFGFDIDPIAVTLCKLNLLIHLNSQPCNELMPKIVVQNTLKTIEHNKTYDIIIGNPPWGYNFPKDDLAFFERHYHIAKTSSESFNLFIECSLNLLNENGLLSFVLPESLLNVSTHAAMRKLLLATTIQQISILGQQFSKVYAPSIVLTVYKKAPSNQHEIIVKKHGETIAILQQRFCENDQYIFNVHASNLEDGIIEYMNRLPNTAFLKDHADFALGIVTGNNKEFILNEKPKNGEIILTGSNIFKYNYIPQEQYIVFDPSKFQQVAPESLYRAKEKLIYRFINANLVFAYDNRQTLSLNSANIVIPKLDGYLTKYILALLNSRAAQFYFHYTFFSVKVLRKHIESIPLPACSKEKQLEIIQYVDHLLETTDSEKRTELYEKIDAMVMNLYQFNQKQQNTIKEKITIKYLTLK